MVEDFLEGTLDSSGQFTLDLAGEASKMGTFQRQEPALWLLKGIQAAVVSRASKVSIRLTKKWIELEFHPEAQAGEASFESPELWCRHLRMALTLALASKPRSLLLSQGDRILFGESGSPVKSHLGVRFLLQRRARAWWQWSDAELAAIGLSLAQRCAFCPIPVSLDRRQLLHPAPEANARVGASRPKRILLEAAQAFPWLSESWKLSEGSASFAFYPPTRRLSWDYRLGERHQALLEGLGWKDRIRHSNAMVSSASTSIQDLLEVRRVEASQDGRLLRETSEESLFAGALESIFDARFLCFDWRWGSLMYEDGRPRKENGEPMLRLEQILLADLSPEQVVAGTGNLTRLEFPLLRCQQWLALCSSGQARGGLYLVEDGILLDPVSGWAGFPGTTALVASSGRATDLSQLKPVIDSSLESLLDQLRVLESQEGERLKSWVFSSQACNSLELPASTREHWRRLLKSPGRD